MSVQLSSIQLFRHVRLFATPWPAACQASLSIANSQSLLKLMSIELESMFLRHPSDQWLMSWSLKNWNYVRQFFFLCLGHPVCVAELLGVGGENTYWCHKYWGIAKGFSGGTMVKHPPANAGDPRDSGSIPRLGRFSGVGNGYPTPVFFPGKSHGQRSLAGYSP